MESQPTATRPSLYAAIRLARLVQKFRERLKARVKTNRSCATPATICQTLDTQALTSLSRDLLPNAPKDNASKQTRCPPRAATPKSPELALTTYRLLKKLDSHVVSDGLSFGEVASKDYLFLHYDTQRFVTNVAIDGLRQILDLTTSLLRRLHDAHQISGAQQREGAEKNPGFESIKCEKLAANLEHMLLCLQQATLVANMKHMLLCLQQATLQAIIRYCLEPLEAEIDDWRLEWRRHWQLKKRFYDEWFYGRRLNDEWFSEWPGGRRPLSTTWPWNIRPSLVVLWGVCWMFYTFGHKAQQEPRGGNSRSEEQPGLQPSLNNYTNTWIGGSPVTRPNTVQRVLQPGLHVGTAFSRAQDITGSRATSATLSVPSAGFPNSNTNPIRRRSVSNPYIIPSTTSSSALFTTSTNTWSQNPGINITPDALSQPHYQWPSNLDQLNVQPSNPQLYYSNQVSSPYEEDYTISPAADQTPSGWYGNVELGLVPAELTMPDYPSPQHSEVSRIPSSPCPSIPANLSPGKGYTQSPSTAHSPDSHQDTRSHPEPPKNSKGEIYCSHADCASNIPVFSRKCEWTKHMDKHTRPYVCDEAGCEKIQGFTYSGGLLRHQREVHKQHGGPKAPRMCPHPDCKRSTGAGFSRKENLQEHLRRVHRGVGQSADKGVSGSSRALVNQQPISEPLTGPRKGKRRRVGDEDEDEVANEMEDLRAQIKRLKKEAEMKDQRLNALEAQMRALFPHPQRHLQ